MTEPTGRFFAVRCASITALLVTLQASALHGQVTSEDVGRVEARLETARAAAVHVLAPRAYERASDRLDDLARRVERGDAPARLAERLSESEAALEAAERAAEQVRSRFARSLAARARAVEQNAEAGVPDAWQTAEQAMSRGGRAAERGEFEDAAEQDARAAELYSRAAESARSARLLGDAIDARQRALSNGGSELAPETFAAGEEALAAGEAGLASGADEDISASAAVAERAFARASWIAALADSVRQRNVPVERLVDAHESDLAQLAAAAGVTSPNLQDGDNVTADSVERAIRDLQTRNSDLTAALRAEEAENDQLEGQVRSLETALTESDRRYTESRDALLARQARDDRLRETQALFLPEEGEVFLTGDDLVLRLHGLTFESGSDEVDESMEPLLTKVQRVLMDFPNAPIRVEGHTDSQGNPDRNRTLSQSRAIAVREYLLSRLPISSSRIEATGFGEESPIARNDTEAGRTRNRRIEIILTLPS